MDVDLLVMQFLAQGRVSISSKFHNEPWVSSEEGLHPTRQVCVSCPLLLMGTELG